MREVDKEAGEGGLGVLVAVCEPILHIGVFCSWHYFSRIMPIYGTSTILFIATGLYPVFLFIHLSGHIIISSRISIATRRFPIEGAMPSLIASGLVGLIIFAMTGVIFFGGLYILATPQAIPFEPQKVFHSMVALTCFGAGAGLSNAVIDRLIPYWRFIWGSAARIMILFTGVLYVPDLMPPYMRDVLAWNPITHGVGLFRQGFYPHYPTVLYDPRYMWTCALSSLLVGVFLHYLFRATLSRKPRKH
jgi:capsular polysaccharide transport system permease protein